MSKTKKVLLLVIGLLIVALSFTGASYAMWQINNAQDGENVVNVGCFETSTDLGTNLENSAINLDKHFPISDTDGMNLTPFTFTITNTCSTIASYQVNLETLSSTTIDKQYIKVGVNNTTKFLNTLDSVETTLSSASSSNMLDTGSLYPGQSITYNIRLWVDEATTVENLGADDPSATLTYAAKITLATSARTYNDLAIDRILKLVSGEDTSLSSVIEKTSPSSTCTNTLAYDGTADNNLRYVGANPCNYVTFNDETWRIIGLMNNIEDSSGKTTPKIKLMRANKLSANYSWDTSSETSDDATEESPYANSGWGINQWGESNTYTGADLMRELNSDYLNNSLVENPNWYNANNGSKAAVFDITQRINETSKSMISNAMWYTGTYNDTNPGSNDLTSIEIYQNEHSTNPASLNDGKYCSSGSHCNDNVIRTTKWLGNIGLINLSDYGFASGGTNRSTCLTTNLSAYKDTCSSDNWINKGVFVWTISPSAGLYQSNITSGIVGAVGYDGNVGSYFAYYDFAVFPTIYLNENVKITSGDGSEESPYILSMD